MRANLKRRFKKFNDVQTGHLFILTLLWIFLAALIVPPVLSHVDTALRSERIYDEKTYAVYTADSGIESALWHVKKGDLEEFLIEPTEYNPYDFETVWEYALGENLNHTPASVSVRNVWIPEGYIDIPTLEEASQLLNDNKLALTGRMSRIPEDEGDNYQYEIKIVYQQEVGEELRLTSVGVWLPTGFEFVEDEETNSLERTGIPSPYEYPVRDSEDHYSGQAVIWTWDDPGVLYTSLPGSPAAANMIIRKITFEYTTERTDLKPPIVSWITTGGTGVDEIPYAWDADMRVFHIVSEAGDARVEARTAKSELRRMPAAIDGDYAAIGNGILGGDATKHDRLYQQSSATMETGDDPTDSNEIPANATIEKAYLYWAGWIDWHHYESISSSAWSETILQDDCANFTQDNPPPASPIDASWSAGGWTVSSGRFQAESTGETLEMSTAINLSSYSPGQVAVAFNHYHSANLESDDYLRIYFRDNGGNWDLIATYSNDSFTSGMLRSITITSSQYLHAGFRIRFVEYSLESGEWYAVDNITIGVPECPSLKYPSSPTPENLECLIEECARVNRVMFTPGTAPGTRVLVEYESGDIRTEPTEGTDYASTWSYACKADVTDIIRQAIGDGDLPSNGAGQYTVGHYYVGTDPGEDNYRVNESKPSYSLNFYTGGSTGYPLGYPHGQYPETPSGIHNYCYAGWSLVIIYSSPELVGHQLYLYDEMFEEAWGPTTPEDPDFDLDGEPGGIVAGFMIPQDIAGMPGRMTTFVVEGDASITGDTFEVNDQGNLTSNYSSNSNNIWDSDSSSGAHSVAGVDLDTFVVDDSIIQPGDTQAQINLVTRSDGFILVYILLSFESVSTTGGAITYLLEL